ncbi:sulfotransferase family 2 domain-containing protein, partial [Campylobacter coli]
MFKDFHDKYKCIFIHVPKVAGSSIERVIYQTDKWLVGHVKASDYTKFDKDKFDSYFSFGFVRNPYDRVVSAYHYLKNDSPDPCDIKWGRLHINNLTFEEFILSLQDEEFKEEILSKNHFSFQYKYLCDKNMNILVNFIGKFEKLDNDFKKILNILRRKDSLVHINKSKHLNYRDYYNSQTYKIIREIYRDDFEIFDYDLEDKKYFNIPQNIYLNNLESKILIKNINLDSLRLKKSFQIQNLNQTIETKNQTIQSNLTQIKNLNQTIQDKDNLLSFQTQYGTAKQRIQNQLSYKLGQTMIINSKNIFGILFMPVYIISTLLSHRQEKKIYQEKIKKNPNLKLPPLESYPDYKEALKEKECLTYKLGEALIKAS